MEEIKKETATANEIAAEEQINEEDLNKVAGGMTLWYQRTSGEQQDGYLVTGDEPIVGEKTSSLWIPKQTWPSWRRLMEHQGHVFFKGDPNPQE